MKKVPLPKITDANLWKQYKKAFDLYLLGTPIEEAATEAGLDPRVVESWATHHWSKQRQVQVATAARQVVELNKDRVMGIINETLEVVETQIRNLKSLDAQLAPKDIKSLAETAKSLQAMVTYDQTKKDEADKFVEIVKSATIQSVADIAKLLQQADPDIDYSRALPDGTPEHGSD